MKKDLMKVLLLIIVSFTLAACGSAEETESTTSEETTEAVDTEAGEETEEAREEAGAEGQTLETADEDTETLVVDEEKNLTITSNPIGEVVIFTKEGCGACNAMMDLLDKYEITYTEKNIYANEVNQAEFDEYGFTVTPSFVVGEEKINGVDVDRIKEVLNLKYYDEDGNLIIQDNNN